MFLAFVSVFQVDKCGRELWAAVSVSRAACLLLLAACSISPSNYSKQKTKKKKYASAFFSRMKTLAMWHPGNIEEYDSNEPHW